MVNTAAIMAYIYSLGDKITPKCFGIRGRTQNTGTSPTKGHPRTTEFAIQRTLGRIPEFPC